MLEPYQPFPHMQHSTWLTHRSCSCFLAELCYRGLVRAELLGLGLQSLPVCQYFKHRCLRHSALKLGGHLSRLAGLVAAGSLHRHSVRPASL